MHLLLENFLADILGILPKIVFRGVILIILLIFGQKSYR